MTPPKKLSIVIAALGAGGAERVATVLSSAWATRGIDVMLLTIDSADRDFYTVHPNVTRKGLDLLRTSRNFIDATIHNLRRVRRLRDGLARNHADIVVSFVDVTNVLTLLATIGLKTRVVVTEHIDPRYHPLPRIWKLLRRLTYPLADELIVLTESTARWGRSVTRRNNVRVIPNPLAAPPDPTPSSEIEPNTVVAMGRLEVQKGFDILINAFGKVASMHPSWKLTIFGEGSERPRLERLVEQLGLTGQVTLPGITKDPFGVLAAADIFALSSRYEGFGNVLLEAMSIGTAVIATRCPSGPEDLITDEVDGLLVPVNDIETLAAGLHRLIEDEPARKRLGAAARMSAKRFSVEGVMRSWDPVLEVS